MMILKFGGSSLGNVEGLSKVKSIIGSFKGRKIVVCSAISGATDKLVSIVESAKSGDLELTLNLIEALREQHIGLINGLVIGSNLKQALTTIINEAMEYILVLTKSEIDLSKECQIITYGELIFTKIYSVYLNSIGIRNVLLNASDFMTVSSLDNPDISIISGKLNALLKTKKSHELFITQGFIRVNQNGEIRHLERGGSDFTATLLGAATNSKEVQIWSDIDGIQNNDPRYVERTFSVPFLSYDEAAELAYFGAKILHPKTIFPVKKLEIPLFLKNTFSIYAKGTMISNTVLKDGIKAISAKDNLMILNIRSNQLNGNLGFIVDKVFQRFGIPIYLFNKSEGQIDVVIDQVYDVQSARKELEKTMIIHLEQDLCGVCLVGKEPDQNIKAEYTRIMKEISFDNNVLPIGKLGLFALVNSKYKISTLRELNSQLFLKETDKIVADKS